MADIALTPLDEGALSIRVFGEYDLADGPQGRRAVRKALGSDADAILIDLSRCRFIDTAALRCVAATHEEAAKVGKAYAVVDSHLQIERFLRILELNDDVTVAATTEKALEELAISRLEPVVSGLVPH